MIILDAKTRLYVPEARKEEKGREGGRKELEGRGIRKKNILIRVIELVLGFITHAYLSYFSYYDGCLKYSVPYIF